MTGIQLPYVVFLFLLLLSISVIVNVVHHSSCQLSLIPELLLILFPSLGPSFNPYHNFFPQSSSRLGRQKKVGGPKKKTVTFTFKTIPFGENVGWLRTSRRKKKHSPGICVWLIKKEQLAVGFGGAPASICLKTVRALDTNTIAVFVP